MPTSIPYDNTISDSTLLTVHPELAPIFTKYGIPPIRIPTQANLPAIRKGFAVANTKFNTSPLARNTLDCSNPEDPLKRYWEEHDLDIPVRDGVKIPLRLYRPKSIPQSGVPVVVIIHGGGWIMGDVNTEATLARVFCAKLGALVVNIGFRNYPEVKFGVPILDCYDAVKWTAANAKIWGGNCQIGFILAGMSGGGAYASICAHLARDEGLTPKITGQWLSCPVLSGSVVSEETGEPFEMFETKVMNRSVEQNKDAPLMNRAMQEAIRGFTDYKWGSKLLTPFSFDDHRDLGRGGIYVQVTGLDPWRDGGRIYQGLCQKEGNKTKLDVYPGLPHCWWTFFPMLKVSASWIEDCVKGMLWLLSEGDDDKGVAAKL